MQKLVLDKFHDSKDSDGNFCVNPKDYETFGEYMKAVAEFKALQLRIRSGEYGKISELRKFGPMSTNHPSVGKVCSACSKAFKEGDYTTLVALGPGDDTEAQEKCSQGRPYNAVAVEVHYSCATGKK